MDNSIRDKQIFYAALEIAESSERSGYVASACVGDAELQRRVVALLAAHDATGEFMDGSPGDWVSTGPRELDGPGAVIGRYKLLEQIGEGGMGVVYMADQVEPLQRRVAVKIIKAGMDTKQVIARFEAERQALALMDHPNIAKVLDAGTTESGRPYFVMELVRGIPVTEYCDDRSLSTQERLVVFQEICSAVQHAHLKGIIHRDIKPSNILVTTNGDRPVPKVIDFGIAKATQNRLTDKTLFTQFRQFIGTPSYMSPEQAQMSAVDVDTRSDIYSLGVLLYELLTGTTPLNTNALRDAEIEEICRRVREEDPPAPSTRVSRLTDAEVTSITKKRRCEPNRLARILRGELDWIIMRAIDKDRSRRYETASELSADIQRHLQGEPVVACPPSRIYKLRKFASRNRNAVAVAGLLFASLALGLIGTSYGLLRAKYEADRVRQATGEAVTARQEATRRADAEKIANDELERNIYAQLIGAAQRHVDLHQIGLAEEKLAECPVRLRGWEWHHLMSSRRTNVIDIQVNGAPIETVALSDDGRYLAAGGTDQFMRLWDTTRREEIWSVEGSIWCVDFSNDGRYLAASVGQVVKTWRLSDMEPVIKLHGHDDQVSCVEFFPDDRRIATASFDGTVRLWDTRSGDEICKFEDHLGPVLQVTCNPTGTQIAAGDERNVTVWDVDSRRRLCTLHGSRRVISLAFGPGNSVIAANYNGDLLQWDLSRPDEHRVLAGHLPYTGDIEFHPDGERLITAGVDGEVSIRFPNGDTIGTLSLRDASRIAFSADGKHLAAGSLGGSIRIWSIRPPETDRVPNLVRSLTGHSRTILDLEFSSGDQQLASLDRNGMVRVWDVGRWNYVHQFKPEGVFLGALAFDDDGQVLCLGGDLDQNIYLFDVNTGRELELNARVPARLWPDFDPNGLLAVGDYDGNIELWNSRTGNLERILPKEKTRWVQKVVFNADGRLLAGCHNTFVSIWDVRSGNTVQRFSGHENIVLDATYSPNGNQLASTGFDGTVRIWDINTGENLKTLHHHFSQCWHVVYSVDGRYIAAGGLSKKSGRVVVWDVNSEKEMFVLEQDGPSFAFDQSGKYLATGGNDSEIHIWDIGFLKDP